jgi:hypothetical protein
MRGVVVFSGAEYEQIERDTERMMEIYNRLIDRFFDEHKPQCDTRNKTSNTNKPSG